MVVGGKNGEKYKKISIKNNETNIDERKAFYAFGSNIDPSQATMFVSET